MKLCFLTGRGRMEKHKQQHDNVEDEHEYDDKKK
jgi:hypothetical protein